MADALYVEDVIKCRSWNHGTSGKGCGKRWKIGEGAFLSRNCCGLARGDYGAGRFFFKV